MFKIPQAHASNVSWRCRLPTGWPEQVSEGRHTLRSLSQLTWEDVARKPNISNPPMERPAPVAGARLAIISPSVWAEVMENGDMDEVVLCGAAAQVTVHLYPQD